MKPFFAFLPLALLAACSPKPQIPPTVTVADAWCRPTPDGALTAACYVTLTASGDDRFVGVATSVAERGEIHIMDMTDGIMRMRKLADGLPLPAGAAVVLKPGAEHIMLIAPKGPLVAGATVPLTLTFEKSAPKSLQAPVRTRQAPAMAHGGMH